MGSFNATCMVTGIEINGSGDAIYLPFKMNHDNFKENRKLKYEGKAQSFWDGGETLFTPYLLPISGSYDTYGGLETIVEDKNTKAIEKYFGMGIERFLEVVTCSREFGSTLSALTKEFMPPNVFSVLDNYSSTFENELSALGFDIVSHRTSDGETVHGYYHSKCSFKVFIDKDSESNYLKYTIHHADGRKEKIQGNFNHALFEIAITQDDYFLGVPDKKQEIVRELYGMSGAFIQKEIYEFLTTFESEKLEVNNEKHPVYSSRFKKELHQLDCFMKNLVRSNRMLKISKSSSEGYSKTTTEFNLGLTNIILEEANKL